MNGPPNDLGENGGIQLRELWRALRRRKRLVLSVAAGVAALAMATTVAKRLTNPVFEGTFQLLISDPINSGGQSGSAGAGAAGDLGGGVVESLARNRTSVDIPTLIQALSSPMVLDPVRRSLGEAGPILDSLSITQAGDRRQNGLVQGVLVASLRGRQPAEVKQALQQLSRAYLGYALSQRQERLSEGLRFLDRQEPVLQQQVNNLQKQLADFRRRHNLLAPETEAGALKTEAASLEVKLRQLEGERARLMRLRRDVANGTLTAANFSSGSSGSNASAGATGSADGVVVTQARSDRLDQLRSVEQQLSEARAVYRSDTPRIANLVALRNQLTRDLRGDQLQALDTALSLNYTRASVLRQQIAQVDRQFLRQPNLIRDYENLQQQLKVAQGNLAGFLTTRSNFQLEQAQNTVPWRVIAPPAVQGFPVEPKLRQGLMQALLLGVAAGVGAGLLRDRFDHVFHSPAEVKEDLNEPLLGHIPHVAFFKGVREDNRFLLQELDLSNNESATSGNAPDDNSVPERLSGYQRFFYQEALRNLFTSLRFLNSDQPLRSVALTSSLPAEGKSLVNVLLAKTLSEMGQRVLLVDADLRKPQLHHRLGLNNLTGLSNLLTEEDLQWQDVVQSVEGYQGWQVLTAGRRPPDPARLLSSARMHELVRELAASHQFDLVLYDTPPVLGLADAALVAQHLDGLMLLVSLSRVDRSLPLEAAQRIRSSGASLLGVVTNAIKREERRESAYGYGYGGGYGRYGYGYGYGGYDPGSAYAYYEVNESEALASRSASSEPDWRLRLQQRWQQALRWLDR